VRRLLPALAVIVLVVTGCSEIGDRIDQATNDAAAAALETAVREELERAGIELDGDPECSTDLDREGAGLTGTAECSGSTVDGQSATASFDGTFATSGCEGSLAIEVDGREIVDLAEIPGCSVDASGG
jgi:hypothetical protein